jgi:hypothetical protein
MRVRNGERHGDKRVTSAWLRLNGAEVAGPSDFSRDVKGFEKRVALQHVNELRVTVAGAPRTFMTVEFCGAPSTPTPTPTRTFTPTSTSTETPRPTERPEPTPTATPAISISAVADPPANEAGWNNTDVTVTFTCSGGQPGTLVCPAPITVSNEGAEQVISGTATDGAGNSAMASVTLSIDKTPPSVTVVPNPPPNIHGWNNSAVVVSFACTDGLSGVSSCSGPVALTSEGEEQIVSGTAVDRAGNFANVGMPVSIDKTAPSVALSAPLDGVRQRIASVSVAGNATDANC